MHLNVSLRCLSASVIFIMLLSCFLCLLSLSVTIGDASGGAGIPVFKGLLAQVRRDGQLAGNFVQIDQDYNLRCQGQGVTHRDSTEKTHGSFIVDLSNSGEGGKLQCV